MGLTLLDVLSNTYLLLLTVPYLPPSGVLALGATSKAFHELIHHTPGVFRHLDLARNKSLQFDIRAIDHGGEVWRNVQLDENVTEDDFYSGPLRGLFSILRQRQILGQVRTLVLDTLSVTSEVVHEILNSPGYNVRVLSIRQCKNLNEGKLRQALEYSCRSSRAEGMPRVRAVYVFGSATNQPAKPSTSLHTQLNNRSRAALREELKVRGGNGEAEQGEEEAQEPAVEIYTTHNPHPGWARTIIACAGLIGFDAPLCSSPRHMLHSSPTAPSARPGEPTQSEEAGQGLKQTQKWYTDPANFQPPAVARLGVRNGCVNCGRAPEWSLESRDAAAAARAEDIYPMGPEPGTVPFLEGGWSVGSSNPRGQNKRDRVGEKSLIARCAACLKGRYCESCHKWWCEDCYGGPGARTQGRGEVSLTSLNIGGTERLRGANLYLGFGREGCDCGKDDRPGVWV